LTTSSNTHANEINKSINHEQQNPNTQYIIPTDLYHRTTDWLVEGQYDPEHADNDVLRGLQDAGLLPRTTSLSQAVCPPLDAAVTRLSAKSAASQGHAVNGRFASAIACTMLLDAHPPAAAASAAGGETQH
jgi:hypothetical protein